VAVGRFGGPVFSTSQATLELAAPGTVARATKGFASALSDELCLASAAAAALRRYRIFSRFS